MGILLKMPPSLSTRRASMPIFYCAGAAPLDEVSRINRMSSGEKLE
jgi:hypothetical protein